MAISVGTAIAISAAVSGGVAAAQIYSAHQATDAQKEAADKALALQKQQWEETQANQAPFKAAGYAALGSMHAAMGGSAATNPMLAAGNATTLGQAMARGRAYTPAPTVAIGGTADSPVSQIQPTQAGFVTMRGPDGSRARVPVTDVKKYQAMGATVEAATASSFGSGVVQ